MFLLINLHNPLRSSIIFYIIILLFLTIFRPKLIKNKDNKYILPIIVLLISTISYYIFAVLNKFV
jgi:glucose uptake protein GlcU